MQINEEAVAKYELAFQQGRMFIRNNGKPSMCLPPKIKRSNEPREPRLRKNPDERAESNTRGLAKIARFSARAAIYTPARFLRKTRDENGKVLAVRMV